MQKTKKYTNDLPRKLYLFFSSYSESFGAPSFTKFAMKMGLTREDIEAYREHKKFEEAYRECIEIRMDYLIDGALAKRFDASLVKFLLTEEFPKEKAETDGLDFTLRVLSRENEA